MNAFDVLGDPVRRRILELLADGERAAGEVGAIVQEEFGISQPAVSIAREFGVSTSSGFGVAPSTLAYWRAGRSSVVAG